MDLKNYCDFEPFTIGILGIIIFFLGILFGYKIHLGWGSIIIAIAIALFVYGISKNSTRMTEKIAKSSVREAIGVINDRRLGLREWNIVIQTKLNLYQSYRKISKVFKLDFARYNTYYSFSIWKCKTYLDRVMIFENNFPEHEENELIHEIDCYFQDLCEGKLCLAKDFHINFQLDPNYIGQLDSIYNTINRLKRFHHETVKDKFRRDRILINLKYLKGSADMPIIGIW